MNNVYLIKSLKAIYEELSSVKKQIDKMMDKEENPDKIDATIKYMTKKSPSDEKQASEYALNKMANS